MTLHLVQPQPKPKRTRQQEILDRLSALVPEQYLKCHRCGSLEFIQTVIGVDGRGQKPRGGTKSLICLNCMMKGERVVIR